MRSNTRNGLPRATAFWPPLGPGYSPSFHRHTHRALRLCQHLLAVSQHLSRSAFSLRRWQKLTRKPGNVSFPGVNRLKNSLLL